MKPSFHRVLSSRLSTVAALVIASTLITAVEAIAQPGAAATPAPAVPAAAQGAPARAPLMCDAEPETLPRGNLNLSVTVDQETVWQPRNGEVLFTIAGPGSNPAIEDILVCFRWRDVRGANWIRSPAIRLVATGTGTSATYAASVPPLEGSQLPGWFARVSGYDGTGEFTGLEMVPLADFRVKAASGMGPLDLILPIGITSRYFAVVTALGLVIIAWGALYAFGLKRCVPRSRDPVMTIIASKDGHGSLSTFQIIMWSFVVGASAVYVMVLSGNLIEITEGTLVLLGISGIATLGNKLHPRTGQEPASSVTGSAPKAAKAPPDGDCVPTAPRKPLWSDLVVNPDDNEIEPSRVQMLFFTVIVALFVALRVLTSGKIPDIPVGYLALMGISNGVYLTAKFIPEKRPAGEAEKKAPQA
jgi:hypothetical protein